MQLSQSRRDPTSFWTLPVLLFQIVDLRAVLRRDLSCGRADLNVRSGVQTARSRHSAFGQISAFSIMPNRVDQPKQSFSVE
jgi:hypothetical protein